MPVRREAKKKGETPKPVEVPKVVGALSPPLSKEQERIARARMAIEDHIVGDRELAKRIDELILARIEEVLAP